MKSIATVERIIAERLSRLEAEGVALHAAAGRYLAEPVLARQDVPPWACAAMDGYAVRSADATSPGELRVERVLYAGDLAGERLSPGEAVRIFTGAPLPEGADCVVPQERAEAAPGAVRLRHGARAGENVRARGEDIVTGEVGLDAGVRLGPRQLGFLSALGADSLRVVRRPRIGLLSTGDEIVGGRIPDSNAATLAQALRDLGAEVEAGAAPDDAASVARAIDALAARSDAVVTIAGVSVGDRDCVPRALERLRADTLVHGVAMKPGKPFLFATLREVPVFGLPGSPSACLVAFEVFARPALLRLAGAAATRRRSLSLPLATPLDGRPGRARLVWAALAADGRVQPLGRDVAQIRGPAIAEALIVLAEDVGSLAVGAFVETWLLDGAAP